MSEVPLHLLDKEGRLVIWGANPRLFWPCLVSNSTFLLFLYAVRRVKANFYTDTLFKMISNKVKFNA